MSIVTFSNDNWKFRPKNSFKLKLQTFDDSISTNNCDLSLSPEIFGISNTCKPPIYDSDGNIIGYQKTAKAYSLVNPMNEDVLIKCFNGYTSDFLVNPGQFCVWTSKEKDIVEYDRRPDGSIDCYNYSSGRYSLELKTIGFQYYWQLIMNFRFIDFSENLGFFSNPAIVIYRSNNFSLLKDSETLYYYPQNPWNAKDESAAIFGFFEEYKYANPVITAVK